MTILTGISPAGLRRLYCDLQKTDSEIAEFFGVDRTSIVKMRKRHNILTRKTIGEIGEEMVMKELKSRGYRVKNMNEWDKLHPYDIKLEEKIRVEVKTSSLKNNNRFYFTLSEKPFNNIESDVRIKIPNGRTRKLYRKTCDLIIFVGLEPNGDCHFFMYRSNEIRDDLQSLAAPLDPSSRSKMNKHREDWDLVKKIVQCANTRL